MVDVADLQLVNQLIDNMIILSGKLEESFKKNDSNDFEKIKVEILDIQKKIEEMVK
jgi:hypothetical protein|tara:strand:+ start:380 stop:547 length:168 start_codon:yes stop_codon:yes gene_type:complete